MTEDAFHEIQLNGKQLVFLFMAATVIGVVVFLCGVMVGRGVRAERGPVEAAATESAGAPDASAASNPAHGAEPQDSSPAPAAAAQPKTAPPPAVSEADADHVYDELVENKPEGRALGKPASPAETAAKPPAQTARTGASATPAPAAKPATPEPAKADPPKADQMPIAPGAFAVQIAALRERSEADAIAKRLVAKGYAAYVLAPSGAGTPIFKVQVGRFKNRQDAEKIAARLKREEQFNPWVTR